jgi:hypothetical protein
MTEISTRITSLERWGMRASMDFQPESVAYVRDAGYTGVLANGGSGIGPDMMTPESLVASTVIPDLMPLTAQGNQREMQRRCQLLSEAGLKPWLCIWGVPGPDESANSLAAESNRFFDRRTKLEMTAKLHRTPEIFGQRSPQALSWRGNRPLCVSHPQVREFYREVYRGLPQEYPELEGIFYFPGDADPELCDHTCPRCRATGLDPWGTMTLHVNELYEALQASKPGVKFYFTIWNQDHPRGRDNIERFLAGLNPGIGLCMSLSDNVVEERKSGKMIFNQPWSNQSKPGELFLWTAAEARRQGRPVMVLGEISQSEVWDPVCHNIPLPAKTIQLLKNSADVPGADAICDFWGNRSPFLPHASHAAMRAYLREPGATTDELLRRAAADHYAVGEDHPELTELALGCWRAFDAASDDWALAGWAQRFSFAIGRDAARGRLYQALVPAYLRFLRADWGMTSIMQNGLSAGDFAAWQKVDRLAFLGIAGQFERLADALEEAGISGHLARREAPNIELAGELIASKGRTLLAVQAYHDQDWPLLRETIAEEIDARERQLEISGRLGWGGGVNPILVSEDIQNMRLYLSSDDFPNTPDDSFHFTATPYSI